MSKRFSAIALKRPSVLIVSAILFALVACSEGDVSTQPNGNQGGTATTLQQETSPVPPTETVAVPSSTTPSADPRPTPTTQLPTKTSDATPSRIEPMPTESAPATPTTQDREQLFREMLLLRAEALTSSDWATVYSQQSEEFKALCPEDSYIKWATYLETIESYSDKEFVLEAVEVDDDKAWFQGRWNTSSPGTAPTSEIVKDNDPYAVWEDSEWVRYTSPVQLSQRDPCAFPEQISYDDLTQLNERSPKPLLQVVGRVGGELGRLPNGTTVMTIFASAPAWNDPINVVYQGPQFQEGTFIEFVGVFLEIQTFEDAPGPLEVPAMHAVWIKTLAKEGEPLPAGFSLATGTGTSIQEPFGKDEVLKASDNLEILVTGFMPVADEVIQTSNVFNRPPQAGNRYSLLELSVTNANLFASVQTIPSHFFLVGDRRIVYETCLAVCPRNTNPHRISSYLTRLLPKNFTDCRHQCM